MSPRSCPGRDLPLPGLTPKQETKELFTYGMVTAH
jgi:hypothetical protein